MSIVDLKVAPVPLLPVTIIKQYVSEIVIVHKKGNEKKLITFEKNTSERIWTEQ